jgi:lipid II:glycine glycyltransferase (peptidoglycan interpeptide bridge formation enzyme)
VAQENFELHHLPPETAARTWNAAIAGLPQPHALQTWEWAQLKQKFGWQPLALQWRQGERLRAAALVLQRTQPLLGLAALHVLYAPKGPLLDDWGDTALRQRVLADLMQLARRKRALQIKIDPDVPLGQGYPDPAAPEAGLTPHGAVVQAHLCSLGWGYSAEQIQFRNTVLLDLAPQEDALLAGMKPKTRYNIRLAQRKGVTIRTAQPADFPVMYHMYAETAQRDGFIIRGPEYYQTAWMIFTQAGLGEGLLAELDGELLGGVMIFRFGGRAWYIYGMSRPVHREAMPNYLLQWEAICRARLAGCRTYDFWGAPESLDTGDRLMGVYRFKEGWGGVVERTLGAWDYTPSPWLYRLYHTVLPRLLGLLRRRAAGRQFPGG